MEQPKNKRNLLVPVGFFLIFIATGAVKLYNGIAVHDSLHIALSAAGIALSITGIILIVRISFKEIQLS